MKFTGINVIKKCVKNHICDYCEYIIDKGESYCNYTYKSAGTGAIFETYKMCDCCMAFTSDPKHKKDIFNNNYELLVTCFTDLESYNTFRLKYKRTKDIKYLIVEPDASEAKCMVQKFREKGKMLERAAEMKGYSNAKEIFVYEVVNVKRIDEVV